MGLLGTMMVTCNGDKKSREKTLLLQKKRLNDLVEYARENSPYYKKLYKHLGKAPQLEELPVITKPEMMSNFDYVLTDRQVNMNKVDVFTSDKENIGRMINEKYLIFKTSGSTGNPAVVLYDKNNIDVSSAVAAFRTFARKEDFKAFMKHGKKTAGVFADHGFYLACGMSRYLQMKMPNKKTKITVDVNSPEDMIVKQLNEFQPAMLSGYPSNLSLLADIKELDIHPDVVITGGELLTDEIRQKLSDRFGCYVQTHYSCTEGGELACECSHGHLHINEDWVILEPVDKDNNPVGYGELSDKVLLTNLSNYIQPFIRYELTDRVIVHDEKCPCGKNSHWLEIEGRTDDILDICGVKIAPMSLYKILEEVKGIRRFQLVQKTTDRLELRLIGEDIKDAFEHAKNDLYDYLESKGVNGIKVSLSDIAPQANEISGKFKHIYSEMVK